MFERLIAVDIGSTWTKGAVVELAGEDSRVISRASRPTSVHHLPEAVEDLLILLRPEAGSKARVKLSSSAKGGLAICAIGLVPDLTLQAARLAACQAGGKVVASYSYRLTRSQLREIEVIAPDIVLLSGGTDGGDERHVLENARALAGSSLRSAILYAGNAAISEEVEGILSVKDFSSARNLMPEVNRLDIDEARARIQGIFLKRIVEGKGLASLEGLADGEILPTPRAAMSLVEALGREFPEWSDAVFVDLGGATTDVYSNGPSFRAVEATILKGLREPDLKRSVEGDLGMRVSAHTAYSSAKAYVDAALDEAGKTDRAGFEAYLDGVHSDTGRLPANANEEAYERCLALGCVTLAMERHAGSVEETYTLEGKAWIQRGKDLRRAGRILGSGGYLSRCRDASLYAEALALARGGGSSLAPSSPEAWADEEYLLPVLGCLAVEAPREAARALARGLRKIG